MMLQEHSKHDAVAWADPPVSLHDLPPPNTKRWVVRRKALVVAGIEAGLLSEDEACARYSLSKEELDHWKELFSKHGVHGLRATRVQDYR